MAKQFNLVIVAGLAESLGEGQIWANSAVIIGPRGLIGKYHKLHLSSENEKRNFVAGESVEVYKCAQFTLGLGICADQNIAELFHTQAKLGAQIIALPAGSSGVMDTRDYLQKNHRLLAYHALTTGAYFLHANQVGESDANIFLGGSCIVEPTRGDLVAMTHREENVLLVADADLRSTEAQEGSYVDIVLKMLRPELYRL